MDSGLSIKPVSGIADYTRPTTGNLPQSTDLPPAQTVSPAPPPLPMANQNLDNAGTDFVSRYVIDPQSREVIYRVIDTRTNQVVTQVPDEALLRERVYSKAVADGAPSIVAQMQADFEA
jgi:hypothetical protein